ncbi:MAG: outer membrane protein assembly factor BamB family protein, partial [Planctomycetota bacterium]
VEIIQKLPARRLFAFDRSSGKRVWAHWDHRDGPIANKYEGHEAASPPVILGDTVYVASHQQTGAITFYLYAYDLYSGNVKWRRLICTSQQEVNMFGNANMEFVAAPLAISDGVIYGTTNLGVCFAVDAESGEIRWLRGYDVIPLPPTRLRGQDRRPVFFANNPVVIHDGVMACTPLDSQYALGLDTESGRLIWRQLWRERDVEVRWLLGELNGEFILSGKGILGITPRSGNARLSPKVRQIASAESLGENSNFAGFTESIPRGAISGDKIYFLGSSKMFSILDSKGNRDPRSDDFQISGPLGNLFLSDGMLMVISQGGVRSYGDLEAMRLLATRALAEGGKDPADYLRVAALLRASTGTESDSILAERAEDLLQQGLDLAAEQGQGANSPVYRKLAEGLFELTIDRAQQLRMVSPDRARKQLYKARERALIPRHWLEAQVMILQLLPEESPEFLSELDEMANLYGHIQFSFEELGNIPVAAFCLWRGIAAAELESAESAALRCQELLERFPEQEIGDQLAGDLAAAELARLIDSNGNRVYTKIESRAVVALREAQEDRSQLRALVKRFPHADAAKLATARLLDLAVRGGNLEAATAYYAEAIRRDRPSAGMMRRMMAAATSTGNLSLAAAFAERLLAEHADEASDLPSDEGATYGDVVESAPRPPIAALAEYRAPIEQVSHLRPPNRDSSISYISPKYVSGFANPVNPPLFISSNDETLHVFSTDPMPQSFADERFRLPLDRLGTSTIYICGELAVLCEDNLIRGVAIEDGNLRWSSPSPMKRSFTSLGVRSGVLHLFSALNSQGDGGKLIGIEVLTGAELFTLDFPDDRSSVWPIAAQGYLWSLEVLERGKFASVLKIDPLDGKIVGRTPIPDSAINFLGYSERRSRLRGAEFQRRMFVGKDAIYLPLIEGDDGGPPKLVAIGFDGEMLWPWTGRPDQNLAFEAIHDEGIVLFEQGTASRLTVLDHRGQERYSNELGLYARLVAGQTGPVKHSAPDILLFANHRNDNQSASLTCWSLDRRGPRFIKDFRAGVQRVYRHPQLGEGFVTIPLLLENTRRPQIQVLDLKTRRGALPDGQSNPRVQKLRSPLTLYRHGAFTLLDTPQGITILGG